MMTSGFNEIALYRWLLTPFRMDADADIVLKSLQQGLEIGQSRFLELLSQHGLSALWCEVLHRYDIAAEVPMSLLQPLKKARRMAAANYLTQHHALKQIHAAFEAEAVRYAVFKGVHVRESIYPDPALRPADDIDLLIDRKQRDLAARILINLGFQHHEDAENVSHEACFQGHNVVVDLHWHIMRPGRTRTVLTGALLQRRSWQSFFWSLDPNDTLFTLLVHPAFAKYVSSPNALLCRLIDLSLWLQKREIDWDQILALLDQAGLKTAAWIVLYRVSQLIDSLAPDEVMRRLEPGHVRAGYLRYWLEQDLPSRWIGYPLLIQIAFTLFLHDRPTDAMLAIQGWLRHKWRMHREQTTLLQAVRNTQSDVSG